MSFDDSSNFFNDGGEGMFLDERREIWKDEKIYVVAYFFYR